MTTAELLSLLRTLLHEPPTPSAWDQLVAALATWPDDTVDVGVDYAEPFLEDWPDAVRTAPFDWLTRAIDGDIGPRWRLVRTLALGGWINGSGPMTALAQRGGLAQITSLDLSRCRIGDEGAASLAAVAAPGLTRLALAGNELSGQAVRALAGGRFVRGLESLDLAHNPLGRDGAKALAESEFPALTSLDLACCDLGPAGGAELAHSRGFPALSQLSLWKNELGPEGCAALCSTAAFPRLIEVDLAANRFTPAAADALLDSRLIRQLRSVNLATNALGQDVVDAVRAAYNDDLSINLSGNIEAPRPEW